MLRSPCTNCGRSDDRRLCSEDCSRLRRYQEAIDLADAAGHERIQGERCWALVRAIFLSRTKSGRTDLADFHERDLERQARYRERKRERKAASVAGA